MGGNFFRLLVFIFIMFGFSVSVQAVKAETFVVNSELDVSETCAEICTLRGALEQANEQEGLDIIVFDKNIDYIDIDSTLIIQDDIIIRGNVTIDAHRKARVLVVNQNVKARLMGLRITGGYVNTGSNIEGAGILNFGNLFLYRVRVYGNSLHDDSNQEAYARGAGIMNTGGSHLYMLYSEIGPRNIISTQGKRARSLGSGIYSAGDVKIQQSNIHHNYVFAKATNKWAEAQGAGIFVISKQSLYIDTSSIYKNKAYARIEDQAQFAKAQGSGVYIKPWGIVKIQNSTISSNVAESVDYSDNPLSLEYAHGGAVYAGAHAKFLAANVTIANNSVSTPTSNIPMGTAVGSAFFVVKTSDTIMEIKNSIIQNNQKNCNVGLDSAGYNIANDASCNFNELGDKTNVDAQLHTLNKNNSFTPTHALHTNSPAKNAGNPMGCFDFENNLLKFDQRGKYRPQNSCDVGAYEI